MNSIHGMLVIATLGLLVSEATRAEQVVPAAAAAKTPAEPADYFPAIKQELARLQAQARCNDVTAVCTVEVRPIADAPPRELTVRYSRATDTVYVFIDKLIAFAGGRKPDPALLLQMMTLNADLVTSKLEWQKSSDSVRLSTVISVDSNFDRRAFRSQYTALLKVAAVLIPELSPPSPKVSPEAETKNQSTVSPL